MDNALSKYLTAECQSSLMRIGGRKTPLGTRQMNPGLLRLRLTQKFIPPNPMYLRRYDILAVEILRNIDVQEELFVVYGSDYIFEDTE